MMIVDTALQMLPRTPLDICKAAECPIECLVEATGHVEYGVR